MIDVRHVLRLAPDAVLGAEERGELPSAARQQQLHGMPQIARDRALIRDQTDALPLDAPRLFVDEDFQAGQDGHECSEG